MNSILTMFSSIAGSYDAIRRTTNRFYFSMLATRALRSSSVAQFRWSPASSSLPRSRSYASSERFKIALIPGDGIGKEVVPAAKEVLNNLGKKGSISFDFVELDAGWETFQKTGNALPPATIAALRTCKGAIFGAVSSPSQRVKGYSSPIIGMRTALDLYANLRPSISFPVKGSRPDVDLLIVRENTECLYVKRETLSADGKTAIAERQITERASTRIAKMAFEQAVAREKERKLGERGKKAPRVTIVHKANVLSVSDGLFRESALAVAKQYPNIQVEEQLVDSMVYKLILDPSYYDVVVAPNLYGDILSDAAAALVGGLGIAPSANVGDSFVMVEPVHGSAPDIAGKGIANPIATFLAVSQLLDFLHRHDLSRALHHACVSAIKQGTLTADLGGKATTADVTRAVIELLNKRK